ncbi:glucose/sorbosone family PQQ-dependent dehydrogenase [Fulvimarina sp. 2208YS6-2-32]|uniref:Glucose/sorbosone family PQQ-dependent dehydrogenase n=1 Tax=Fulvimarina uroteuthidis TaxID=3098149 RepID=A0ABU5I0S9_9HYPH|nr:glucose/sorbosone family PQQ-dependent dehydrogenase [Fulvimarina sp. 2208YS6-2-32]MDY8108952.1 glucose/sorbosone family PQQ-dependent dehydrogenase [Fulvimarina sp. 2208YS6-2-32]
MQRKPTVRVTKPFARRLSTSGIAAVSFLMAGVSHAQVTPVDVPTGQDELFSSRVLTSGLDNPWAMQWGPDDKIWLTERTSGEITRVDPVSGTQQLLLTVGDLYAGPQHEGLLGLALHPELLDGTGNDYVYVGHTVNNGSESEPDPSARIVRYTWDDRTQQLTEPMVLIEGLPAWNDHNAGRVVIGPDMKLYYSIGEQGANFGRNLRRPNLAQELPSAEEVESENWRTYSGKILRLNLDGSIPEDNPTIEGVRSHIYSYGHRNPQGIAFGPNGTLYETEHGPSSDDELNIIKPGGNYGWPIVAGFIDESAYTYINWSEVPADIDENTDPLPDSVQQTPESTLEGKMVDPLAAYWTVETNYPFGVQCGYICDPTIAPSSVFYYDAGDDGIAEWDNSVLIPTLKHGILYVQPLTEDGQEAKGMPVAWFNTQNRYRDILVSPDGREVFIATDAFGSASQAYGEGLSTTVLHNPGAILKFTYGDEAASAGLGLGSADRNGVLTAADAVTGSGPANADQPKEWEDPATGGSAANGVSDGSEATASDAVEVGDDSDVVEVAEQGLPKFIANCASCHGANGEGGAGAVLAGNENLADDGFVAETIVHGLGYMPAFGNQLSNQDIAHIGTYIRNSWGNEFGLLTEKTVVEER